MDENQIILLMAATILSNQHSPASEQGKPHLGYRRAIIAARGLYDEYGKFVAEDAQAKAAAEGTQAKAAK